METAFQQCQCRRTVRRLDDAVPGLGERASHQNTNDLFVVHHENRTGRLLERHATFLSGWLV
jgi:hypothetical protein